MNSSDAVVSFACLLRVLTLLWQHNRYPTLGSSNLSPNILRAVLKELLQPSSQTRWRRRLFSGGRQNIFGRTRNRRIYKMYIFRKTNANTAATQLVNSSCLFRCGRGQTEAAVLPVRHAAGVGPSRSFVFLSPKRELLLENALQFHALNRKSPLWA